MVDDLDALAARLRAAGHRADPDHDFPRMRRFYTDDPHGNRLEVLEPVSGLVPVAVTPIGRVSSTRTAPVDDDWDAVPATITLDAERFGPDALAGLEEFSHVEVVYLLDRVDPAAVTTGSRHPRGNTAWPRVGIFAQRAKDRPNRLATTTCALLRVEHLTVHVRGLDAVDGSPVLDLKPHLRQFAARGPVTQPGWADELVAGYWSPPRP